MNGSIIIVAVFVSILAVILLTSYFRLNAFFSLISVSVILAIAIPGIDKAVGILNDGFGKTLGSIGLIIVFGTALGVLLEKSGATSGMADYILSFTKKEKSTRAIAITGTIAGFPIFCDSGFIVLNGLNHSLSRKSGIPVGRLAATLAISLYTLHCFVPPHPGITAASAIVGGNQGRLVLMGTAIAIPGIIAGYLWIKFRCRSLKTEMSTGSSAPELKMVDPLSPFRSFLPVILPLFLISLNSLNELLSVFSEGFIQSLIAFTGKPAVALLAGIIAAILVLPSQKLKQTDSYLVESIEKAGPILLVTAAGGTFGAVIRATGFGDIITEFISQTHLGLLVPFLMAVLLKTAQGSSTVAAITSASILAPMLGPLGLDSESGIIMALLATGAGTMAISHTNDSFFWVITRFTGISPSMTLKIFSSASLVVSVFCFILIYLLSLLRIAG